jgi:hypothetical protein
MSNRKRYLEDETKQKEKAVEAEGFVSDPKKLTPKTKEIKRQKVEVLSTDISTNQCKFKIDEPTYQRNI